jgi:ATP-dependent exoDNAse (exonuclease V) beta subunit
VLTLEVEEQAALRHQRILEVDSEGVAAATSEENYAAWKREREALLHRASQPSILVQTATSRARTEAATVAEREVDHAERSAPVVVEILPRSELQRPSGRRFGALVHAVLSTLDLDASADALEASTATNGRLLGATENEIRAAIQTVGAACGHPILRRAAISAKKGQLRRETPVMMRLEDGTLVEGVVDLAFREDTADFAGCTVVDFKTDREFEKSSREYTSQVRIYADAVAAATNCVARGILLVL